MTGNSSLFQFSLQERALHELAKACWGNYSSSIKSFKFGDEEEFLSVETLKLIGHRKNVVNIIPRIFTRLPTTLRYHLVDAVVLIQRGYSEALVCTNFYRSEIKFMTIFPLSPGPYAAKNFIDPSGRFDEINWAKRFVSDESQSVYRRFDLACFYCFEGEIKELWGTMEGIGRSHYEKNFRYVENKFGYMASMWVHRLENKFESPSEFPRDGFVEVIDRGYEHAARFFWNICSINEKEELMLELEEFNMTCNGIFSDPSQFRHEGFVNFYYSLLSLEQKHKLISLTAPGGAHFLWSCLVTSRSYETVLKDIQTIPFPTSSLTYAYVLNQLTLKMVELPIPVYEEIFKVLWEPLSETEVTYIFDLGLDIIINLTEVKSMDLLKMIIEPLDRSKKEMMLIYDWQLAGLSALTNFLCFRDFDGLRRYLLFFLMYRDRVTQKLSVKTNGFAFFNTFIRMYNVFRERNENRFTQDVIKETDKVIDGIQGSLLVLYFLPEQVDDVSTNSCRPLAIDRQ